MYPAYFPTFQNNKYVKMNMQYDNEQTSGEKQVSYLWQL